MAGHADCNFCGFSLEKIETMALTGEEFPTAQGRNKMKIGEVDQKRGTIKMIRSTGNWTGELKIEKLKLVHDMIHRKDISNHYKEIDLVVPRWGNYISAILKYFGCR